MAAAAIAGAAIAALNGDIAGDVQSNTPIIEYNNTSASVAAGAIALTAFTSISTCSIMISRFDVGFILEHSTSTPGPAAARCAAEPCAAVPTIATGGHAFSVRGTGLPIRTASAAGTGLAG